MLRALLAGLLTMGLPALAPVSAADESYALQFYKFKKGDKSENEKSGSTKTSVRASVSGMNTQHEQTSATKEIYTEEVLEKKDGTRWATKLTRTYTVAERTEKGEVTKAGYVGETVLIEKRGEKYEFSAKGKVLKEDDAPELVKEFNDKRDNTPRIEDLLPDAPAKLGVSWKSPADKSARLFKALSDEKMTIDAKKSTITGKLLKVYKKDAAQFGILELNATLFVTEVDLGGKLTKTSAESKIVLKVAVDTCIDGTVGVQESKMEMAFDITAELLDGDSVTINSTLTGTEKWCVVKK